MTQASAPVTDGTHNLCVQLDGMGNRMGFAEGMPTNCDNSTSVEDSERMGSHLISRLGFVSLSKGGQYPGLYLFSSRARMMRPVKYVLNGHDDSVGSFEQM